MIVRNKFENIHFMDRQVLTTMYNEKLNNINCSKITFLCTNMHTITVPASKSMYLQKINSFAINLYQNIVLDSPPCKRLDYLSYILFSIVASYVH